MLKFDQINKLIEIKYREIEEGEADKEEMKDLVLFLMLSSINDAIEDTEDMLGYVLTQNISADTIAQSVYRELEGMTFEERLEGSEKEIKRTAETECHRVYAEMQLETAKEIETSFGISVNKKWVTMKDNRVRDTHEPLENISIPLNDYFISYDGDKALAPGGFNNASNNINCRCVLEFEENS